MLFVKMAITQCTFASDFATSLLQTKAELVTRSHQSQRQTSLKDPNLEVLSVASQPSDFIVSGDDGEALSLSKVDRLWGKNGKCLSFIHIPKTAGTSIEETGEARSVQWGKWDLDNHLCSRPAYTYPDDTNSCYVKDTDSVCSAWHVPPSYDLKLLNHYKECETFCVVRNPTTRLVSQWQWHLKGDACTTEHFQAYVNSSFAQSSSDDGGDPYIQDCHLLQQVEYTFDSEGFHTCKHMLRFEQLESEFNALMREFEINATLTRHDFASGCSLEVPSDFIAMIKERYHDDFSAFQYN